MEISELLLISQASLYYLKKKEGCVSFLSLSPSVFLFNSQAMDESGSCKFTDYSCPEIF